MSDTGKKISIAGFVLGAVANIVWFILNFTCDKFGLDYNVTNTVYTGLVVIALLLAAAGFGLKFFEDKNIFDFLVAGTCSITFLLRLLEFFGISFSFDNLVANIIYQVVANAFMITLAVNVIRKGNVIFGLLLACAFLFFAFLIPYFGWEILADNFDLFTVYICSIGVVEFGFFSVAALSELKEG